MNRILIAAIALYAGIAVTTVCQDQRVTTTRGSEFTIDLPSDPVSGYSWSQPAIDNDEIVFVASSAYIPQSRQAVPGETGTTRFIFKALNPGSTAIRLNYRKHADPTELPAKSYFVEVSVS